MLGTRAVVTAARGQGRRRGSEEALSAQPEHSVTGGDSEDVAPAQGIGI